MTSPKSYPNTELPEKLREADYEVSLLWEIKGPSKSAVAWLSAYSVKNQTILVSTDRDGGGWQAFLAVPGTEVEAVIRRIEAAAIRGTATPLPRVDAT